MSDGVERIRMKTAQVHTVSETVRVPIAARSHPASPFHSPVPQTWAPGKQHAWTWVGLVRAKPDAQSNLGCITGFKVACERCGAAWELEIPDDVCQAE